MPNRINNTPATLYSSLKGATAPSKPREAPKAMNTKEKPTMKLMVWRKICLRSGRSEVRTDAPAMLARYTGTSGKIQGDKKDRIPAARAVKKVMLDIYVSFLFSIAIMP
jgi:hypothetical protein